MWCFMFAFVLFFRFYEIKPADLPIGRREKVQNLRKQSRCLQNLKKKKYITKEKRTGLEISSERILGR